MVARLCGNAFRGKPAADGPHCYVGDVVEATETDDGLAIKGRFDLDTEFGKSAYRNTKGRRVSGLSIGYAIRNSTKTTVRGIRMLRQQGRWDL